MRADKMRVRSGQHYEAVPSFDDGVMEQENNQIADKLKDKVHVLKSLSLDIGEEVKYQGKLLHDMDDDMERSGTLLGNTASRILRIARGGHNSYILYLFLFSVFAFFVLYLVLKVR